MLKYIPNLLSLIRIILAVILFLSIREKNIHQAIIVLIVGGATDFLDGYFARKFKHLTTKNLKTIGGMLDPLADKIFFGALFVALLSEGFLPLWLFIIFIIRDVLLLIGTIFIKIKGVVYEFTPTFLSKINTTLQFIFGLIALIFPNSAILLVLVGVLIVTTCLSALLYLIRFVTTVFE